MQSQDFDTGSTAMAQKADKMLIEDAQIKRLYRNQYTHS